MVQSLTTSVLLWMLLLPAAVTARLRATSQQARETKQIQAEDLFFWAEQFELRFGGGSYVEETIPITDTPTPRPTPRPTASPTPRPTPSPTPFPTPSPTPFPTPSPTLSPVTDSPTFNPTAITTDSPTAVPCQLNTKIECSTDSGRSCQEIFAPREGLCDDDDGATGVEFLFTGNGCGDTRNCEDNSNINAPFAYITASDGGGEKFSGVVALGEVFRVPGPFDSETLSIEISSSVSGGPGPDSFQSLEANLGCSGSLFERLALQSNYGALQLVGFSSASQGIQSVFDTFTFVMTVANEGPSEALVQTATGTSPFQPIPITLVDSTSGGRTLEPAQELSAATMVVLNLAESQGRDFELTLTASGINPANGLACDAETRYTIRVE